VPPKYQHQYRKAAITWQSHVSDLRGASRQSRGYLQRDDSIVGRHAVSSIDFLLKEEFRRFPAVEEGRIVGAITGFDILPAIQANRMTGPSPEAQEDSIMNSLRLLLPMLLFVACTAGPERASDHRRLGFWWGTGTCGLDQGRDRQPQHQSQ